MMGLVQDTTPMEWHMPVGGHVQIRLGIRVACGRRVVLARLCVSRSL